MAIKKQEIIDRIENHGFKLISFEEENIGTYFKVMVQCGKGHEWITQPRNFLESRKASRPSKGCPECAKQMQQEKWEKITLDKVPEGIKVLGNYVRPDKDGQNNYRMFTLQCSQGHTYDKIQSDVSAGCPKCNGVTFVGQERTRLIFETQFQKSFPSVRPDWLKNTTGRNLELDGYCEELKIAFEYQGRQHFSNSTQFGGDYAFQSVRDQLKVDLCEQHGVKLITVIQPRDYNAEKFFNSVKNDCEKQGVHITVGERDCRFHRINDNNTLVKKYDEFKDFVESKNYKLVSASLSTMKDVLDFECTDGHKFKMTPENFKVTYSRPQYEKVACAVCNHKTNSHSINSLVSIETCQELAKQIGYKLESTIYENVNEPMIWTCRHAHTLSKSFRQMTRNQTGQYCMTCKELKLDDSISLLRAKATGKSGDISKVSKSAQGEVRDINWLNLFTQKNDIKNTDGVYLGMDIKHNFCCSKGHSFVSTISNLVEKEKKNTSMCPDYACGGKSLGLDECKEFAKKQGLTCLSDKYENVNAPMDWQCDRGHTFTKSYRSFQRSKTSNYCPQCSGVKLKF